MLTGFVKLGPGNLGLKQRISCNSFKHTLKFERFIFLFRYSREESFTTLNVDIRNHQNLIDSLEQYVKGDLLEGANAYHCEKCNKKVSQRSRC